MLKSSNTCTGSLFTLDDFGEFLGEFEASGYRSTNFANLDPSKRQLKVEDFLLNKLVLLSDQVAADCRTFDQWQMGDSGSRR